MIETDKFFEEVEQAQRIDMELAEIFENDYPKRDTFFDREPDDEYGFLEEADDKYEMFKNQ